jgi:hypothetical protein
VVVFPKLSVTTKSKSDTLVAEVAVKEYVAVPLASLMLSVPKLGRSGTVRDTVVATVLGEPKVTVPEIVDPRITE